MDIDVTCPKCKTRTKLPDSFSGGDFLCPACGMALPISKGKMDMYREIDAAADSPWIRFERVAFWFGVMALLFETVLAAIIIFWTRSRS